MAEHWTQIPLLKYSPGRVLYFKKTLLKSVIHNSRTPLVRHNTFSDCFLFLFIIFGCFLNIIGMHLRIYLFMRLPEGEEFFFSMEKIFDYRLLRKKSILHTFTKVCIPVPQKQ